MRHLRETSAVGADICLKPAAGMLCRQCGGVLSGPPATCPSRGGTVPMRMRIVLPDRPGTLARVTGVLGRAGADVQQVSVLSRQAGRAWDDVPLRLPAGDDGARLIGDLEALGGVVVEGLWPTRDGSGYLPELDLLAHVLSRPERWLLTTVDALPGVVNASWAAAVSGPDASVVYASAGTPHELPPLPAGAARPGSGTRPSGGHLAWVPLDGSTVLGDFDVTLLVGREGGAPFHKVEVDRLGRVLSLVVRVAPAGV